MRTLSQYPVAARRASAEAHVTEERVWQQNREEARRTERVRPGINGRPAQTSRVNPAEDNRGVRLACLFSTVYRACFCRPAVNGRPEPRRLFHPLPKQLS